MDPVDLDEKLTGSQRMVEKAANSIRAAEAQVNEAQSRFDTLSATFTRYQELRARGFISQEMLDAKRHEKNAAASALAAAIAHSAAAGSGGRSCFRSLIRPACGSKHASPRNRPGRFASARQRKSCCVHNPSRRPWARSNGGT